jgi:mRNA interferase MazF
VVVSPVAFRRAIRFAIVCPITSRIRPFGTSVVLPPGFPIAGEILAGHVRSIDTTFRPVVSAQCRIATETMADLRAKLAALMGICR